MTLNSKMLSSSAQLANRTVTQIIRNQSRLASTALLNSSHSHSHSHSPSPSSTCRSFATNRTTSTLFSNQKSNASNNPFSSSSQVRTMFIQTESTPNEDSLKFLPGQKVMENGSHEFLDIRSSMTSPLAKQLFQIDGVKTVFYGPDFVTVSKDSEHQWSILKPEIYSTIMEFFTAGHDLFTDPNSSLGSSDTLILDTDSETTAMVKELLDTRVRPAIQEDGGDIEFMGFEEEGDGIVRLKLKGSCRGCDSSTVTLKSGIERMLMHYIPEVKGVEQVLDQEEAIALDEFSKLEKKLAKDRERETSHGFSP